MSGIDLPLNILRGYLGATASNRHGCRSSSKTALTLHGMTVLEGKLVRLRPLEPGDVPELRRIHETPEVAGWWGSPEDDFPLGDDPGATRFTLLVDGRVAGLIQYGEEREPDYRHAWIDLFVDPELHGRGLGTDAVTTVARHLVQDHGHHRITIDPAVDNVAAIRSYEKAGFEPVGVTRLSWRDPEGEWRDGLLMELIAPPRESQNRQ
jgi:aminoglycoside 6'-N-acetyltransferase